MGFFDRLREKKPAPITFPVQLGAAASGIFVPMGEIPDAVFSAGVLGTCCGVEPAEGAVYAPVDGKITQVADTLHAIGIAAGELPPLFLVLVLSFLERWLEKHLPDVIKAIAVPFLSAVIMVPLTILVIGPISDAAANGLAIGYNWLAHTIPVLAAVLVGGLWQVFVIFGIHWGVTPMNVANFAANHCDTFQAFQTCAVVAQAAACLGVFLKSRNRENKNVALSAGVTGIFGITEPAIYGVTLRLKKPFVAGCIGGAVGAVIISLFGTQYYAYAGLPGLLTTVNAICPTDPEALASLNLAANPMSFPGMMIGVLATIVITVALVMFIGCGDEASAPAGGADTSAAPANESPAVPAGPVTVCVPLNGELKSHTAVSDPAFAGGILGQGAAIIPTEGRLYAPFDCTVFGVADTKHAVNLVGPDGIELLIHIGLDTVELLREGESVRVGDPILTVKP